MRYMACMTRRMTCRLAGLAMAVVASGCVTVYQPMRTLQRPVAIDAERPNFEGLKLLVRCHPDEAVDAPALCRRVSALFVKQGAAVRIEIPRPQAPKTRPDAAPKAELILDVKSRRLHENSSVFYWVANLMSFTLIPAVTEATYEQEISVRDQEGFVLAEATMQARFIESFGLGAVVAEAFGDLLGRTKDEAVLGENHKKDFTKDFYSHLSQVVHNGRIRSRVLHNFDVPSASAGATP